MGWFSPIKGIYPGLPQVDKTLPADSTAVGIVRGTAVYVTSDDTFKPVADANKQDAEAYVFFTLVGQDDFQAGMAGTVGYGGGGSIAPQNFIQTTRDGTHLYYGRAAGGNGMVTALAVGNPMEFQTDQYDASGSYSVGDYVTVGSGTRADGVATDGLIKPHTTGDNVVAQVTKVPFNRWVNDAPATGADGRRTGANVQVIQLRTVWIPQMA